MFKLFWIDREIERDRERERDREETLTTLLHYFQSFPPNSGIKGLNLGLYAL